MVSIIPVYANKLKQSLVKPKCFENFLSVRIGCKSHQTFTN